MIDYGVRAAKLFSWSHLSGTKHILYISSHYRWELQFLLKGHNMAYFMSRQGSSIFISRTNYVRTCTVYLLKGPTMSGLVQFIRVKGPTMLGPGYLPRPGPAGTISVPT